jgi:hypothetical protein
LWIGTEFVWDKKKKKRMRNWKEGCEINERKKEKETKRGCTLLSACHRKQRPLSTRLRNRSKLCSRFWGVSGGFPISCSKSSTHFSINGKSINRVFLIGEEFSHYSTIPLIIIEMILDRYRVDRN